MTTKQATNFLGIPIEGTIQQPDKRVPQQPLSDLEPTIRAVIDDPEIVAFGWRQYTPYFNDGDPCVFGLGEPWFVTTAEDADYDDRDTYEFELSSHPSLATSRWDGEARRYVDIERDPATTERAARCHAFAVAIGSGAFNDVLLEAFGDHAHVKITRDGITVDEYSHD